MANDIRNRVEVMGTPEQVEEVFEFLKSKTDKERLIDFNNITPIPKWVYGSSPDVMGISSEDMEKYGRENTSLDWAYKNWGTKWNAYEMHRNENVLHFDTANGTPAQLIEKVAWLFPDVIIKHFFYDSVNPYREYTLTFKDTTVEEVVKDFDYDEEIDEWAEIGGED